MSRLFFTEAGLAALRTMMMDRRLADPKKFAHIRQELSIDFGSDDDGVRLQHIGAALGMKV